MKPIVSSLVIPAAALILAGCAQTTVTPLAKDTVHLSTTTAPICGRSGATNLSNKQAAVHTLRRGYDKYTIMGGGVQVQLAGGGVPAQGLTVKMYKNDDPAASNALSAREQLGPNWQEIITKSGTFC